MRRERYRGQIIVARQYKIRYQPIWRSSVSLERLVKGNWRELPIAPELRERDFTSEEGALATALACGRSYVDALHALPEAAVVPSSSPLARSRLLRTSHFQVVSGNTRSAL